MITVVSMTGLVTVQDLGRHGYGGIGVARGGAMDRRSMARANALVGNPLDAAVLEWALGGGSIEFSDDVTVAIAGAEVEAEGDGATWMTNAAVRFRGSERLSIRRFVRGRFAYVAVRGGIDVPLVLGSRSTHLSAGFGGHQGRRIRAGDRIAIGKPGADGGRTPSPVPLAGDSTAIRVLDDSANFPETVREDFWRTDFRVSPASDRTGYRLTSPGAKSIGNGMMTSEPVCAGTIQIPPGGDPIVLMVEGPTVGGYPKVGVVASVDLGRLAQKQPGDAVAFERITREEAHRLARAEAMDPGSDSP